MAPFVYMLKKNFSAQLTTFFFLLLTVWWLIIFFNKTTDASMNHIFGFIYGGFSIWGGIWGLSAALKWGGFRSLIGRALLSLSVGLLFQAFGQYSFWYINYFLKIEIPYPGIPDIGYFGTIPFYIYGAILLAKSSGAKMTLKSYYNKTQAIIVPAILLCGAYILFLRDYQYDWSVPLRIFLDFGYPMGQAIYISIAILTYMLSRKLLGGIMRFPILFLVFAFFAQFLADYVFIYFHSLYFPASFIDYFYLLAYFIMTLGLIQFKVIANQLYE